jgi:ribulose 1,5-bisphosphate synthetase/thiazole synthase
MLLQRAQLGKGGMLSGAGTELRGRDRLPPMFGGMATSGIEGSPDIFAGLFVR